MPSAECSPGWNVVLALVLCVILAGCSGLYLDRRDAISLTAGDAVAANKVAQVIDPWPAEAVNPNIAFDGERIGRGVARYRAGRTTPLQTTSTSSVQYQPVVLGTAPSAPVGSQ